MNLPEWALTLKERYEAGVAGVFLLHGNVRDYYRLEDQYELLVPYLYSTLLGAGSAPGHGKLVVIYSFSGGLRCPTPGMEAELQREIYRFRGTRTGADMMVPANSDVATTLNYYTDPAEAFPLLEFLITTHEHIAIVIEEAEAIAPASDLGLMNATIARSLMTLRRWAGDPHLSRKDAVVILVAENLSDIHPKLLSASARLETILVPLPDRDNRAAYINTFLAHAGWPNALKDLTEERVASLTGGLTLEQVDDLLRTARYKQETLSFDSVIHRKKSLVETSVGDLVEVIQGGAGLEAVGGMERQKAILGRIVDDIKAGHTRRIPKGIYMQGAPGTGKTFLMTAFGNASGLVTVVLKSFYNKYVGGTEANVERLLGILEAMGPLLLILDEYDQSFGHRGSGDEGDSGVRQRVWGMFSAFLSRPDLQGMVIPVALLNRSDLVDVASKRAGRFDLRMPLFLPDKDEQLLILQRAFKNNAVTPDIPDWAPVAAKLAGKGYSPADLNKIAQLADERSAGQDRESVAPEDLLWVMDDYVPSEEEDPETIEYMELLAARSSSSKSFLPDHYRRMLDEGTLDNRLRELRGSLQSRGAL
ncbi:MAG TPA: ATP-binding protein [Armatimonadota bacterium]|jgi:SpoVK/Ycf46/Vps4 family AAA+-type ATPase